MHKSIGKHFLIVTTNWRRIGLGISVEFWGKSWEFNAWVGPVRVNISEFPF